MATYYSDMVNRKTCVYRAYIGEELVYIGLTMNPDGRFSSHRSQKDWWKLVDLIEVEWFDGREAAKRAEREAIRDEAPVYNQARPFVGPRIVVR